MTTKHLDLFSGIGGFALAARWMNWETIGFCEIEAYCQKVLAKHWPDVPIYDDVRELTSEQVGSVDIITGGFPCQDLSYAGKGAGIDGERSGLWSEIARLTGELRPRRVVLENVSALLSRGLDRVTGDLAALGYSCEWHCIPASAVGAPHQRDRIWIVAYPDNDGPSNKFQAAEFDAKKLAPVGSNGRVVPDADQPRLEGSLFRGIAKAQAQMVASRCSEGIPDADSIGQSRPGQSWEWCRETENRARQTGDAIPVGFGNQWSAEPDVGRVANGIPARMDRLKGLGNAIVPQVAHVIFLAIQEQMQCQT